MKGRVEALAWIIENRKLQAALDLAIAALPSPAKLVRVDAEVEGLLLPLTPQDQTPATLVFAGGGKLSADLVVGADGTTSRLRSLAGDRASGAGLSSDRYRRQLRSRAVP
jgi:2-polyprenyl-6-methoxyphenol hydroxylase-like FAD-dependent oxidoreductase